MTNKIFTATGCARCKITKRFMQQQSIDYDEFDIKAEGKDAFAKFYRENRKDIFRDADGVEFPVFSDGEAIRQGVSVILGFLIAGDGLSGFIKRSLLHGEWIDGFDISGGDPKRADELVEVLGYLKQNGLKVQVTTDGRNADVLEQVVDKSLADRVIMQIMGPAHLYPATTGTSVEQDELARSMALASRCAQYQFRSVIAPLVRDDGTVGYLTPEEIAEAAKLIESATGSKKHPYQIAVQEPGKSSDERLQGLEALPSSALFKYRTAARRYMVMAEIEK
jgi:pyruvate formate lyase activating enzyme